MFIVLKEVVMMSQTITSDKRKFFSTKELTLTAIMAAVIAICAWITIPATVEFTLQIFGVFCALEILGGKNGTFAIIVYILLGAVGLPVFAGFSGGLGALTSSTGGYIIGFLFIGLVYWASERFIGKHIVVRITAMLIGLALCYAFGTAWFMYVYTRNTEAVTLLQALKWCVFPFIPFDIAKMALAILIANRVKKYAKL